MSVWLRQPFSRDPWTAPILSHRPREQDSFHGLLEVTLARENIELADDTYDLRTGTRTGPGWEYDTGIRPRWDTRGDIGLGL